MMDDDNPFSKLAEDVKQARSRASAEERALQAARRKVSETWQIDLQRLLAQASSFLAPAGLTVLTGCEFERIDHSVIGLGFGVGGLQRAPVNLSVTVIKMPNVATVKLGGSGPSENVDISGIDFPEAEFARAVALVLRKSLPETKDAAP